MAVLFLMVGCSGSDSNDSSVKNLMGSNPNKVNTINLGAADERTDDGESALPIIGWSTTLGQRAANQCFDYDTQPAQFETATDFQEAKTTSEESSSFGISASNHLKLFLFRDKQTFKMVDNSNESARSVSMWFDALSTGTINVVDIKLNDTGRRAVEHGAAYFGQVCGDKVIKSFPILIAQKFNIAFQGAKESNVSKLSGAIKIHAVFDTMKATLKDVVKDSGSDFSLGITVVNVGEPDLFDATLILKADEDLCMDHGDCDAYGADLIAQFNKAKDTAVSRLDEDPTKFAQIYNVDYSNLTAPGNLIDVIEIPGVSGLFKNKHDPYKKYANAITNSVNVYADLLSSAQGISYVAGPALSHGFKNTVEIIEDYAGILNGYAANLLIDIDACFTDPGNCTVLSENNSIFEFIDADDTLDADAKSALKSSVQALIYDVDMQYISVSDDKEVSPPKATAGQKLVYLNKFTPEKNVAVTLDIDTHGDAPPSDTGGGVFDFDPFTFDQNTLSHTGGPNYYKQYWAAAGHLAGIVDNTGLKKTSGNEFLDPSDPSGIILSYTLTQYDESKKDGIDVMLTFTPRLDYLQTINPFMH